MIERGDPGLARSRWEVGGEFDDRQVIQGPYLPWPTPNRLYGLATHAVVEALASRPGGRRGRLHIPSYFCPEVVETWRRSSIEVTTYLDDPRWTEPDWSTVRPEVGDAVLAVNFFGIRGQGRWAAWRDGRPDVLLIEDHSHDPGSAWARNSTADFAIASLRKTLPVSDGGILWSPRGAALPPALSYDGKNGSVQKREAMALKGRFLAGLRVDKAAFRALQLEGESTLLASSPSAVSDWSAKRIGSGLPLAWRTRRRRNVATLIERIERFETMRPLFTSWRRGQCPFSLVLLFASESSRDACRSMLVDHHIYPPVHWGQPADATDEARMLSKLILTIPADQRYGARDIERVAAALLAFEREQVGRGRIVHSNSLGAR